MIYSSILISLIYCYDLFFVVRAASLAYSMRHHQSAALGTLHQIGNAHLPICPAAISSSLRGFILWTDRHGSHLLKLFKNILDNRHSRVRRTAVAVARLMVEIRPTSITDPFAIFITQDFHR